MSGRNSRHPFTNALYELQPDGTILVTEGTRQGRFGKDGRWISGDLREADPQLCVWVGNNPDAVQAADSHLAQPS